MAKSFARLAQFMYLKRAVVVRNGASKFVGQNPGAKHIPPDVRGLKSQTWHKLNVRDRKLTNPYNSAESQGISLARTFFRRFIFWSAKRAKTQYVNRFT